MSPGGPGENSVDGSLAMTCAGIASLFVEGSVVAVSAVALLERVPIPGTAREAYAQ